MKGTTHPSCHSRGSPAGDSVSATKLGRVLGKNWKEGERGRDRREGATHIKEGELGKVHGTLARHRPVRRKPRKCATLRDTLSNGFKLSGLLAEEVDALVADGMQEKGHDTAVVAGRIGTSTLGWRRGDRGSTYARKSAVTALQFGSQ